MASSGTALTSDQIRLIHRFTNNITVLYDGDGAGIKASIRGIDMLLEEGMNIKVCLLPDGEDPDSFARKHNATEYQAYINNNEVDFIRFKTNLLMEEAGKDPIKRAELISSIVKSISVIPDSIVRSVYIRECSQLLKMDEKVLVDATAKLIEQAVENKAKEEERKKQREEYNRRQEIIAAQAENQTTAIGKNENTDNNINITQTEYTASPTEGDTPLPEYIPEETPQIIDTYSSYIPAQGNENKVFYKQEENLVKMIIRYGEKIVCCVQDEEGNEQPFTVTEYIAYNLKVDDIQFHNPIHRRILKEAEENVRKENFVSEKYFLSNPDPEISKVAADMSSDRYQLSNYHSKGQKIITDEERLYELVPRLLMDFKISILKEEMKHTLQALNDPAIASNPEKCAEIMTHFRDLTETQNMILRDAGDRTTSLY